MKGELYINGNDAWETWGVNMGEGFLDAIDSFVPMKDYIENESRLEHGKKVIISDKLNKVASRDLTLHFTIKGENESDFRAKRRAFETEMQKVSVKINVPAIGAEIYKLLYLGKSVSFAMNRARTFCTVASKFEEPNPMDRAVGEDENT